MEYIEKCKRPPGLVTYQTKYMQGWLDYYKYKTRQNKPSDNYWTDESIRLPLIKSFKNNCGYCGKEIETYNDKKPAGQVDHFFPKSKLPKLAYEWNNYIWSCSDCNKKKLEQIGFLNPCNITQMKWLDFDGATGRYLLKPEYRKNSKIKNRFEQTLKLTLMNSNTVTKAKKDIFSEIKNSIDSLRELPEKIKSQKDEECREYYLNNYKKAKQIFLANLERKEKSHFFTRKRIINYICWKENIKITELFFSIRKV